MQLGNTPSVENVGVLSRVPADYVVLACGFTDMRLGIDGLAAKIQQVFQLDPCAKNLYLFCGRRNDRIKGIFWEGDGFVLLYKRLEQKGRFQWPRRESEARLITDQQLRWLLEGLSIEQPKALRKVDSLLIV